MENLADYHAIIYNKVDVQTSKQVNNDTIHGKDGMLIIRDTVAIPAQEHRQVIVNVFLGEIVRKLLEIQYRLSNYQTVMIDTSVSILSQTEFLCKQRNAFLEFRNGFNRLVQVCIGHGVLWCRGLMTGLLRGLVSSCTFIRTKK